MSVLHFALAKLQTSGNRRSSELCLRFKAHGASIDFAGSEAVLQAFCFPLGPEAVSPKEYMASEEYTFTLTHGDGERFQGFCRKVLPPAPRMGSKLRYPQVLCIISQFPWCTFYFKVLQVVEQLLRTGNVSMYDGAPAEMPPGSHAFKFLQDLATQLSSEPGPGQTIRIACSCDVSLLGVSPPRSIADNGAVAWGGDQVELQVPPDCGNGKWNCGISLARLLWHVPVSALLTLLAAMLLERRIIIIGSSQDTVTAVVQAAAAVLYPFRWHHIYLPLVPRQLKDYLDAPMPFLVGLPAQMLPALRNLSLEEVTLVDVDLGKCDPAPGSCRDDALLLPWREKLEAALTAAYGQLRSPTEFESSPLIAGIMQEYFLKLIGDYPYFIQEEGLYQGEGFDRYPLSSHAPGHRRDGSGASSSSSRDGRNGGDSTLKGHGFVFRQAAFVAHHRQSEKSYRFLSMFRHSQMYEVFIQERLKRAALAAQGANLEDAFEQRLARSHERRHQRHPTWQPAGALTHQQPLSQSQQQLPVASKVSALLLKKHRNDSTNELPLASRDTAVRQHAAGTCDDPASFFDDIPEPDGVEDRLMWCADSPGQTRELRAASAMPAFSDMKELRAEMHDRAGPLRSSDPRMAPHTNHRPDQGLGSVPALSTRGSTEPDSHSRRSGGPAAGGLTFSFQSGYKHYEGNFSSVIKAMWSDRMGRGSHASAPTPSASDSHGWTEDHSTMSRMLGTDSGSNHSTASAPSGPSEHEPNVYRRQHTGDGRVGPGLMHRHVLQSPMWDSSAGGKLRQPPPPSWPLHDAPSMNSIVEGASEGASDHGAQPVAQAASLVAAWDPFSETRPGQKPRQ